MVCDCHAQSLGFSHQHRVKLALQYIPATITLRNGGSQGWFGIYETLLSSTQKTLHTFKKTGIHKSVSQRDEARNQQQREVWEIQHWKSHGSAEHES